MSSNNDSTDDQHPVNRRDFLAAAAAMGLTLSPGFLGFGEEDRDIGVLDTHNVQNSGEWIAKDPMPLNFADGLQAEATAEGGVDVTAPGSELTEWSEDDSGTLSGPSMEAQRQSTTGEFSLSTSENNPFQTRSFEESGPPSYRPHKRVSNPVLTAADVSDVANVSFIADPFLVYEGGQFHAFFEVAHDDDGDGTQSEDIGHATSPDGLKWTYNQLVLSSSSKHYAYPFVFKHGGTWYMVPDRGSDNQVEIYTADSFPDTWSLLETPLSGGRYVDPTVFKWGDYWYLIACDTSTSPQELNIYYSSSLTDGSWSSHSNNPIRTGNRDARPAGRPIIRDDAIDLFLQDVQRSYGDKVRCFRVTDLSPSTYADAEVGSSPIVQAALNGEWNDDGMHQIDGAMPYVGGKEVALTDGKDANGNWSIGVFTNGENTPMAKAHPSTTTSVSNSTWTTVPYDTIEFDTEQAFDTTNNVYKIPTSGYYEFTVNTYWVTVSGSPFRVGARLYNTTTANQFNSSWNQVATNDRVSNEFSTVEYLPAGDEIRVDVWQNSGGSIDVNSDVDTYFTVEKVR